MTKNQVCLEEISSWIVTLLDEIQAQVEDLSDSDLEPLVDDLEEVLQKFFNYPDFRNYN